MATLSGGMPLVVAGEIPSSRFGQLDLNLFGSTGSGLLSSVNLYLHNVASENILSGVLPLTVFGSGVFASGSSLPVALTGGTDSASASLNLFVSNSGLTGGISVWCSGYGRYAGATPADASMPLYIARPTTSVLNLYVLGPGYPASGGIPVSLTGVLQASGYCNVVIPSAIGVESANLNLSLNGW